MLDASKIAELMNNGGLTEGHKYCTTCGEAYPLENFDRDALRPDGHRDICKACRAAVRVKERERRHANQMVELERQNLETLSTLTSGGSLNPHCSELLESLMEPFGGQRGYAKQVWAEYLRAPPGGQLRFKYMQMIMELCKQVSKLDLAERRLEMLEDDDVVREMRRHLKTYQDNLELDANAIPTRAGGLLELSDTSLAATVSEAILDGPEDWIREDADAV